MGIAECCEGISESTSGEIPSIERIGNVAFGIKGSSIIHVTLLRIGSRYKADAPGTPDESHCPRRGKNGSRTSSIAAAQKTPPWPLPVRGWVFTDAVAGASLKIDSGLNDPVFFLAGPIFRKLRVPPGTRKGLTLWDSDVSQRRGRRRRGSWETSVHPSGI